MPAAQCHARVRALTQPPIPLVQSWPAAYSGDFGPLLDLSQAVPDFRPHPDLMRYLGECAADPQLFGYGPIAGEPSLRRVYSEHMSERYGAELGPDNTHITSGCNQAFVSAMIAVAGAGDNVVMCNPSYFNHETSLAMLGVGIRHLKCDASNGFLPSLKDVEESIDEQTRAVLLTTPNNPTGAVYPPELLASILSLCEARSIWLVLDETYRDFLSSANQLPHTLFQQPRWRDNLIQLYSFSKSFCIPGHRLGTITASEQVITEISKVMDNLQICAPRAAQVAVSKAMPALADWREQNRLEIQNRAACLRELMQALPEWKVVAMGAYFAFIEHPFEAGSLTVAKALAEQRGVTCLPGVFFGEGNERFLRFAFANVDTQALSALPEKLKTLAL